MRNADAPAMPQQRDWQDDMEIHANNPLRSGRPPFEGLGLTKREEFARAAMQALAANSGVVSVFGAGRQIASEAVRYADELLAELERTS
ncbi:hypothetical protein [Chromohalobacter sp. 296-RDG]|uniref:hypothetical protein n=1 Tax=Chromohalobacter sp. 296-RDG TaxID=2994062 RepID=UPI002469762E|nr:hypothetical protein [Chromohalobacter sp. 296-RDG]